MKIENPSVRFTTENVLQISITPRKNSRRNGKGSKSTESRTTLQRLCVVRRYRICYSLQDDFPIEIFFHDIAYRFSCTVWKIGSEMKIRFENRACFVWLYFKNWGIEKINFWDKGALRFFVFCDESSRYFHSYRKQK